MPAAVAGILLLGFATRLAYGFEWDELQLLHGAWSMAHGLLPYRDFFEHHPPLLHALVAPLVGGETEISWRLLLALRVVALAVVLGAVTCFARLLGRSTPDGTWWGLLALIAVCPIAGKLFELRADWAALLCVLGAMILVAPGPGRYDPALWKFLLAGGLGGVAVCFTQKALMLVAPMLGWTVLASAPGGWRVRRATLVRATILATGAAVAPALLAAVFWWKGALGDLVDSVIGVNLDWPREVRWQRLWKANSTSALGPLVLTLRAIARIARCRIAGSGSVGSEELAAFLAAAGLLAFLVTPVPWEQSYLLLVAPWVAYVAVTSLARYAEAPEELRRDCWILGTAAVVVLATLPAALAARAAVVWGVALPVFALALGTGDVGRRLERALLVLVMPGVVFFARDRLADVAAGRGVAQARFAHAAASLAPIDAAALTLWDHVLPFRPAASFHWFAHAGVLERLGRRGGQDVDSEYVEAVERGGVQVVIADEPALADHLPRLRRVLLQRCRLAVRGYAGSDAWACGPTRDTVGAQSAAGRNARPKQAAPPPAEAPNVVLIVIDTLRLDHVGCYGYRRPTTPHIDALAREGVLFDNPVSQAPWTGASVASLLTGLHPSVHGLDAGARWDTPLGSDELPFVVQRTLHPSTRTLTEVLRAHGYCTAGFVSNVYLNAAFGFARGFDVYEDDHADYSGDVFLYKRRGDETNHRVARWLQTGPPEPFFLLVHYNDPHWPYDPPRPHGAEWVAGYRGPLTPAGTAVVAESEGRPVRDLDPESLAYIVGLYDGEVHFADATVGALLERLRQTALSRPVLTVLTADHGEEFLDHGSMSHGYTLYDEQLRVPLVMHFPGRLPAGRVRPQVRLIDVMPTVLDLAGLGSAAADTQGVSLVALARGQSSRGSGDAFSEAPLRGTLRSVRTPPGWKLVEDVGRGRSLLFDLVRDPRERTNVSTRAAAAADALARRASRWVARNAAQAGELGLDRAPPAQVVVDEATRKRLEALGYVSAGAP